MTSFRRWFRRQAGLRTQWPRFFVIFFAAVSLFVAGMVVGSIWGINCIKVLMKYFLGI